MGLDSGADPQFVSFLLQFLDEVDEHVCLGQVLWEQNKMIFTSVLEAIRQSCGTEDFYVWIWMKIKNQLSI